MKCIRCSAVVPDNAPIIAKFDCYGDSWNSSNFTGEVWCEKCHDEMEGKISTPNKEDLCQE